MQGGGAPCSPEEILPVELWEQILLYLDQKALLRATLVCATFKGVIENSRLLFHTIHMCQWDHFHSRNVHFYADESHGDEKMDERFKINARPLNPTHLVEYQFPICTRNVAFISEPTTKKQVVSIHISSPGTYFCVNVGNRRPIGEVKPGRSSALSVYFLANYFPDGTMHSLGEKVDYTSPHREAARYTTGDTIGVETGVVPQSDSTYCIFLKNGKMVHTPFVFKNAKWPLYIGVCFTKEKERVRLVPPMGLVSLPEKLSNENSLQIEKPNEATPDDSRLIEPYRYPSLNQPPKLLTLKTVAVGLLAYSAMMVSLILFIQR